MLPARREVGFFAGAGMTVALSNRKQFRRYLDAHLQTHLISRTYVSEPDVVLAGISLRTLQDFQSELIQHVLKRVTQFEA
jgi:hypothetical protein